MFSNRPHRRAAIACKACSLRKVRCTVTLSGPPCANCSVDGLKCELKTRKRRRNSDLLPGATFSHEPSIAEDPRETAPELQPGDNKTSTTSEDSPQYLMSPATFHGYGQTSSSPDTANESSPRDDRSLQIPPFVAEPRPKDHVDFGGTPLSTERFESFKQQSSSLPDAAQSHRTFAEVLEGGDLDSNCIPFYPGDRRGPAFVIDICEPNQSPKRSHFFVPTPAIQSMAPEDVTYIRSKGVFSLPPPILRDALMQSYFQHVHPFCPILDASEFIPRYEQGRVSLLLLWSMYLASTSFIDERLFSDESYPTRLALKRTAYQRAKASHILYDVEYEKDKITLIQSVFLLGFWYTGTDDRTGPWHWNGIAISLSQGIGLHRRLVLKNASSESTQSFWRRLWWTIYCREAWLSLGHGRPMRISLDDSDLPIPGLDDINILSAETSVDASQKYLPGELCVLFDIWLSYVKISRAVGTILSTNYPAKGTRVSNTDLEHSESEIRACFALPLEGSRRSRLVAAHLYQFKLYFQAAIIVLYRPFLFELPFGLPIEATEAWRTYAAQKARAAASEAIGAVNSMIAEDLVRFCQSITVLALVAPMQIHLLESASSNPVRCQMGKHNLALCMLAMSELRKVYISADAIFSLFETAQEKIDNRAKSSEAEQIPPDDILEEEWPSVEVVVTSAEGVTSLAPGILSNWWAPFPSERAYEASNITHTDSWLDIQRIDRDWTIERLGLSRRSKSIDS